MNLISTVTTSLSVLTVIAQIAIILGIFVYFFPKRVKLLDKFFKTVSPYAFGIPIFAMLASLFFSEVAHYSVCVLCWYQRIVMYPQALILGVGFLNKDKNVPIYSIGLSIIGAVIATYHYLLQIKAVSAIVPCANSAVAIDCSQRVFMHFGYITIPMMALTAFILIIVLQALQLKQKS